MKVIVLPGDGVGVEVTEAAVQVLRAATASRDLALTLDEYPCGGAHWLATGQEWSDEVFLRCRDWADAVFLGAVGWPGATLPDGDPAGKSVLFGLRFGLDLYANVRPVRLLPGVIHRLGSSRLQAWVPQDVDFVIVRENTEGLYAPVRGTLARGGTAEVSVDSRVITRRGARRVIEFAFRLARQRSAASGRPARVTCVDKSNVLDGCRLFRQVFREVGSENPDVGTDERFIDAFCQAILTEPQNFDVAVTTNMFGDIASDVAAVLSGGLGLAPSAEVGDSHGLFEPVHGSAPPLAGTGRANPLAAILSAAMMLEWYGHRLGAAGAAWGRAAAAVNGAVASLVAQGRVLPEDLGGVASCRDVADEVCRVVGAMKDDEGAGPGADGPPRNGGL